MDKELLLLLRDARLNRNSENRNLDFVFLYQLASQHQVSALIYNQIYNFEGFPLDLKEVWKRETLRTNAVQTIKTDRFLRVYKKFLEHDLKVIVVKGLICRSLYPQPDNRPSNDEDLYVEKDCFVLAKDILLNDGFRIVEDSDSVTTFLDPSCGLSIELHTELFSKDSKAYGSYQNLFDHAFDDVVVHRIYDVDVYSLSYDLHLLFLLMHFVKHFLHGGVGIRQILDIIMYSEKYGHEINWENIYKVLDEINVYTLIMNVFALAYDYLDFDFNCIILPEHFHKENYDYLDLLNDIIDAGIFGKSSIERLHSSTMTLNATSTGKSSIWKSVFPSFQEMTGKYSYLKKYPLLLPIAWLSRIFTYLTNKKEGNSQKTIEIGNQRIALLKKYKVIK